MKQCIICGGTKDVYYGDCQSMCGECAKGIAEMQSNLEY